MKLTLSRAAEFLSAAGEFDHKAIAQAYSIDSRTIEPGELFFAVRRWQETSGDGGLLLQDVFIRLSGEDYLAPDLAWWAAARRPRLVQGALDIVPDLVVEVLSPATRINDLGAKKDAYLAAGARELWLADPQAATITTMQPDGRQQMLGRDDELTCQLLPGFVLEVARVFLT